MPKASVPRQALLHKKLCNANANGTGDPSHGVAFGQFRDELVVVVVALKDARSEDGPIKGSPVRWLQAIPARRCTDPRIDVNCARWRARCAQVARTSHAERALQAEKQVTNGKALLAKF